VIDSGHARHGGTRHGGQSGADGADGKDPLPDVALRLARSFKQKLPVRTSCFTISRTNVYYFYLILYLLFPGRRTRHRKSKGRPVYFRIHANSIPHSNLTRTRGRGIEPTTLNIKGSAEANGRVGRRERNFGFSFLRKQHRPVRSWGKDWRGAERSTRSLTSYCCCLGRILQ